MWRFRGFEAADWRLLLRAGYILPLRTLQLRLRGYAFAARQVKRTPSKRFERTRRTTTLQLARRTAWIVSLASRYGLCRGKCLARSLTLIDLLHAQGIEADLRIGVQKPTSQLDAHAWVEYEGVVLNDDDDVALRFAPVAGAWRP
jgi:hypothetical protein